MDRGAERSDSELLVGLDARFHELGDGRPAEPRWTPGDRRSREPAPASAALIAGPDTIDAIDDMRAQLAAFQVETAEQLRLLAESSRRTRSELEVSALLATVEALAKNVDSLNARLNTLERRVGRLY